MGFYRNYVLPRLCDFAMRNKELSPFRARIVGAAEGRVLEIGAGSGMNLGFYHASVRELFALEPDQNLTQVARTRATVAARSVTFLAASAEEIPLDDRSMDTVVTTWTLCSIPDALQALREMRRVLKPAGHLLFVEHGLAPEPNVRKWQNRLDPIWSRISGGCHLNRPTAALIESGGFVIDQIATGHISGPKPMTFMSEGRASLA
jgi:ubiquinone/menaquinone biosynthesis C-methylase UbiE